MGDCEAARRGGKEGGQLSPEVLEKCRKAGREGGMLGKDWGIMGGGPGVSVRLDQLLGMLRKAW